jgi:hypothetical protein
MASACRPIDIAQIAVDWTRTILEAPAIQLGMQLPSFRQEVASSAQATARILEGGTAASEGTYEKCEATVPRRTHLVRSRAPVGVALDRQDWIASNNLLTQQRPGSEYQDVAIALSFRT